jgi:hypothetical protein
MLRFDLNGFTYAGVVLLLVNPNEQMRRRSTLTCSRNRRHGSMLNRGAFEAFFDINMVFRRLRQIQNQSMVWKKVL